jgi:hypothetical protein
MPWDELTIREIDEEPDVRSTFEGDRNRQRFARRGLRRRRSDPHRDRQGEGVGQRREMALVPVITDSFAPFKTFENRGEFQSFQRFRAFPDVRGWRPPKSSRQIRRAVPHSQRIATSQLPRCPMPPARPRVGRAQLPRLQRSDISPPLAKHPRWEQPRKARVGR